MEIDFNNLMTSLSDDQLQEYIDHWERYVPEAIEAAIAEMKNRGRSFSDEDIQSLLEKSKQKKIAELKEDDRYWGSGKSWRKNIVQDEKAPAFYTEGVIYTFSVLFSVLFGAILLAMNFRKTESKKGIIEVIVFGIAFTGIQIWILSMIHEKSGLVFFSIIGALILRYFFWQKYIGQETKYRAKPIWIPLIIGVAICALFILNMIYGAGN